MTDAANRERPRPPSVRSRVRQPSAGASIVPAKPAQALSPSAQALAGAALAPATVRAYRAALAALDHWLAALDRAADDAALADYLAARHDAGAAPASIGMTVAAVKAAARLSGQPSPAGPETARVLAGIRRKGRGRGRGQAKGLQWSAADTVAAVAANNGRGKLAGLRDAALVALASDGLLARVRSRRRPGRGHCGRSGRVRPPHRPSLEDRSGGPGRGPLRRRGDHAPDRGMAGSRRRP